MILRSYHPDALTPAAPALSRFGECDVAVADPSVDDVTTQMQRLEAAAREVLAPCSTADLVRRIEAIVEAWSNPRFETRQLAEAILPGVTGFSPAMIREGLALHFQGLRPGSLSKLLDRALGDASRLNQHTAPGVVAHILSGNLPGVGVVPTLVSLLVRASAFVKAASGDPLFPALFAQSIAAQDPELGRCVAVAYWRGGRSDLEEVIFTQANVVNVFGSDATIADIAPRVRGHLLAHGHRVSFAFIDADTLGDTQAMRRAAVALADDVALWDQQGCLSPQLCYVEAASVERLGGFAELLVQELDERARRWPIRKLSIEERAAIARFRQEAEWTPDASLLASSDGVSWALRIENDPVFAASCLNRCLRIKAVSGIDQVVSHIEPHRHRLEACGIADAATHTDDIAVALERAGVHRVCPLGEMQRPGLDWRQGGRSIVLDLLSDRLG